MKPKKLYTHPFQPTYINKHGTKRFKENKIISHLLESHPTEDLNSLIINHNFSIEDWEQFTQLIGYSICGWADLSCVRDSTYKKFMEQEMIANKNPNRR